MTPLGLLSGDYNLGQVLPTDFVSLVIKVIHIPELLKQVCFLHRNERAAWSLGHASVILWASWPSRFFIPQSISCFCRVRTGWFWSSYLPQCIGSTILKYVRGENALSPFILFTIFFLGYTQQNFLQLRFGVLEGEHGENQPVVGVLTKMVGSTLKRGQETTRQDRLSVVTRGSIARPFSSICRAQWAPRSRTNPQVQMTRSDEALMQILAKTYVLHQLPSNASRLRTAAPRASLVMRSLGKALAGLWRLLVIPLVDNTLHSVFSPPHTLRINR